MGVPPAVVESDCSRIAADLASQGWTCRDGFLSTDLAAALRADASTLVANDAFRPAAIGSGAARAVHAGIRGDEICWLDRPLSPSTAELIQSLEQLRGGINRELQLGLFDLELHFARYRPGTAYARHLDRFAVGTRRVLSLALYLNEAWRPEDGGELRLHAGEQEPPYDFSPQAGRLVLFLSGRFEHEVLLTTRERLSITGWFLARAS